MQLVIGGIEERHGVGHSLGADDLDLEAVGCALVEVVEIVCLQELVAELGEAHPTARVEPPLNRIARHHHRHREVLSHVPQEVDELELSYEASHLLKRLIEQYVKSKKTLPLEKSFAAERLIDRKSSF